MKKGKRLLSLILTIAMIIGLVPVNSLVVNAEEPKYKPVVLAEGEEWVQTTKVEDGKEYVIVAGEENIALANDEMKVETAPVTISEDRVIGFNENAVWTWDEETGLFTQKDETYVKVIGSILATKWNIDGLKQELKADEETGLTMLQMEQYGENKRLVYKKDAFEAVKVDKKDITAKNSLRLFVKTTVEEEKAVGDEVEQDSPFAPIAPTAAEDEWILTNNLDDIKSGKPCVVVAFTENKALVLQTGDGAGADTIDVNISDDKLVEFDESLNSKAVLKWNAEFESLSRENDILTAKQWGEGVTTNNNNIGQNKAKYDTLGSGIQISSVPDPTKVVAFRDGTFKSVQSSSVAENQKLLRIFVKGGSGSTGGGDPDVKPDNIRLDPETATLTVGEELQLIATITPSDADKTLTWTSSNETVAKVDNGTVTAVAEGTATITAKTSNGIEAKAEITVESRREGITAEFYLITSKGVCKYALDQTDKDENIILKTNANNGFKAEYTKTISSETDLLENPLETFEVSDELKNQLTGNRVKLYEVRSATRTIGDKASTNQKLYGQHIYASENKDAYHYEDADWYPNKKITVARTPIKDSTLKLADLDSTTIKYIYVLPSEINYYVIDKKGNQQLITSEELSVSGGGQTIKLKDFTSDAAFVPFNARVKELTGFERNELVGKGQELYVGDDEEPTEKFITVRTDYVMEPGNVGQSFYTMNVYYGEPIEAGNTSIQLPVTMYDFDADGMFFEYCLGGDMSKSFGYSMLDRVKVNDNLVVPTDGRNPYPQYDQDTYKFIAGLISTKTMWNGTTDEGNSGNGGYMMKIDEENPLEKYMNTEVRSIVSTLESSELKDADYTAAMTALKNGTITKDNANDNPYMAAAYMMGRFFNGDETYGKKVNEVSAIELKEYEVYDGNSYYIYDAAWNSTVDKGVIQNTLDANTHRFQPPQLKYGAAFYMPLDWVKDENDKPGVLLNNTKDQYENANFLFTTVGQGSFIFEEEKNLEFTFVGDDDVYLFINNKLALDLGGAHQEREKNVKLNTLKEKCGLENGQVANFTFYHMERHGTGSNFRMITNINISAPELITHKYAYDGNTTIGNGESVEPEVPYYYAFQLSNSGERDMFNLSFWDQDLGVSLFPLNPDRHKDLNSKYNVKFDNVLNSWGDVVLEIFDGQNEDGSNRHPEIKKYEFKKIDGRDGWHPNIPDENKDQHPENPEPSTHSYTFGDIDRVKVSVLYDRMTEKDAVTYPAVSGLTETEKEEAYRKLMEEILRNGIRVGQKIIISGFAHALPAGKIYRNEVQTYGSDWEMNEIHGSDTHKVIARDIKNVVKVIDYGKPVTYDFYEIFQRFEEGPYTMVRLNMGEPGVDDANYVDASGNTYKNGYKWDETDKKLVKTTDTTTESTTTVNRGDGTGYLWKSGESVDSAKFTFVPGKFMDQYAKFAFQIDRNLIDEDTGIDLIEPYAKYMTIYPANVVYYEDNFEAIGGDATTGIVYTGKKQQGTDTVYEQDSDAGTNANADAEHNGDQQYGYDQNYDTTSGAGDSNGTSVLLEKNGTDYPTAKFTFKGTGFDIVGRTSTDSSVVSYVVARKELNEETNEMEDAIYKMGVVDTLYQNGTLYQIPVIRVTDLPYDEYTVALMVTDQSVGTSKRNTFYLDGIRIYNPMYGQDTPYLDSEYDTTIEKLNKLVLNNGHITETGVVDENGKLTVEGIKVDGARAALVNVNKADDIKFMPLTYTEDVGEGADKATVTGSLVSVLRHGPNNEIYLNDQGAIALVLNENPYAEGKNGTLQVEAKLVATGKGTATNPTANISYLTVKKDGNKETPEFKDISVNTTTAMYYEIPEKALIPIEGEANKYLVIIRGGQCQKPMTQPTHMISFSNVKYNGCVINTNPTDYADKEGGLGKEWFKFATSGNKHLLNVTVPSEKVKKNQNFEIVIKKPSILSTEWADFEDAVLKDKHAKAKFVINSRLGTDSNQKKTVNYKARKNGDEIVLNIKAPKVPGVYTITLEYTPEEAGSQTEAFSFSINVVLSKKDNA